MSVPLRRREIPISTFLRAECAKSLQKSEKSASLPSSSKRRKNIRRCFQRQSINFARFLSNADLKQSLDRDRKVPVIGCLVTRVHRCIRIALKRAIYNRSHPFKRRSSALSRPGVSPRSQIVDLCRATASAT